MPFPLLGAIAAGVGLVGGAISSSNNRKATSAAVGSSERATAENNALARETRDLNTATLSPFVQQGGAATSYINSLLGIRPQGGGGMDANAYLQQNPDVMQGFSQQNRFAAPQDYARFHFDTYGKNEGRGMTPTAPGMDAQSGFDAFRNSTGYQFRLNEGNRAVSAYMKSIGQGTSGKAYKTIQDRAQNTASAEFGNFYNALAGQQSVGLNAASAQAGVANNFSSQVQQNNAQNASNVGNAALARAGNNNAFLSSLIGAGGYALGGRG